MWNTFVQPGKTQKQDIRISFTFAVEDEARGERRMTSLEVKQRQGQVEVGGVDEAVEREA